MKTQVLYLMMVGALIMSCASADKLLDNGQYDAAIRKSLRKLSGKETLTPKHLDILEEAYTKVQNLDLERIQQWKNRGTAKDWSKVIDAYDKIADRQRRILAILPASTSEPMVAQLPFVNIPSLLQEAIDSFLSTTYAQGQYWLQRGRDGSMDAARKAYEQFDDIWQYKNHYRDARDLQDEAQHLGTFNLEIKWQNLSAMSIPYQIRRDLLSQINHDPWIRFVTQEQNTITIDGQLTVRILEYVVGPERWSEYAYPLQREVQAGFKYQLDENGNVQKDSLGNDIKVPVFRSLRAIVTEVQQSKAIQVFGEIAFDDFRHSLKMAEPFEIETVFEHRFANFEGHPEALTPDAKRYLHEQPLPYPEDEELFIETLADFGPKLGRLANKMLRKQVI